MLEPAVTLSDLGLTAECLTLAWLLRRAKSDDGIALFRALFMATAAAAFLGALVHGWFPLEGTAAYDILWPASMLAVGATGAILWLIGIDLLDRPQHMQTAKRILAFFFIGYAAVVLLVNQRFYVALAAYLPAAVFLGLVFARRYFSRHASADLWGLAGIALSLAAGAVQYFGVAPHPRYFDHNALYHAIEAVALLALFLAARGTANTR